MELTESEARRLRMRSLLLDAHAAPAPTTSVADVVTWFGAMQAQDDASGLWSLGVRLPELTRADVIGALERGEAVRTWPMRGTLHLVPAADAGWMVRLMGARSLARAGRRHEQLGLDSGDLQRAVDVLGAALRGTRLTRAACLAVLEGAGIDTSSQRGYHLLLYAAQVGVTCVTPNAGRQPTFALLDEWAPRPHRPDRETALATMARRFVRSHGPVRVNDLVGWTGLAVADVRGGLASARSDVVEVSVAGVPMVVTREALDARLPPTTESGVVWRLLPAYDEYLLGYKNRALALTADQMKAVIPGRNGVFQATVVRDGRVVALWRRRETGTQSQVTVTPLETWAPGWTDAVRAEVEAYSRFLDLPVRLNGV